MMGVLDSGCRKGSITDYGPGAGCIDTTWPVDVTVSFPVDTNVLLAAMEIALTHEVNKLVGERPWLYF